MKINNIRNRGAFTLVEMLVVIGIIAVLVASTTVAYSRIVASAEKAKCSELVKNVHTALVQIYNENGGAWPRALVNGREKGLLDESAAVPLAKALGMSYTEDDATGSRKLTGYDKFGIVTPWAAQVIKRMGNEVQLGSLVPSGGTIEDHILRYDLDTEGNGAIRDANVGGSTVSVRGTAMVWCCGKDGVLETWEKGRRRDDVYSWTPGDTHMVGGK